MVETKTGFWASLFDFSFKQFVTPKMVKVLYLLSLIGCGLLGTTLFIGGIGTLGSNVGVGLLFILISPIAFFVMLIYARVILETVMVLFQLENHVAIIKDKQ